LIVFTVIKLFDEPVLGSIRALQHLQRATFQRLRATILAWLRRFVNHLLTY